MDNAIITGTVERFLFQNPENGFTVLVLINGSKSTTVKGTLPPLQAGQEIELEGNWIFDKKFGKQFEASRCTAQLPTSITGIKKYLGSGLIKGIGATYAERLVNHFGSTVLTIIDTNPERLREVDGIGAKRLETIIAAWKDQKEISKIMVFLQDKGIATAHALKIYKKYKQESLAVVQQNPYRLASEVWGIGFKTADTIAQKLGFAPHCPQRLTAGICFALSTASSQGHLYLELEELRNQTLTLLELTQENKPLLKRSLHELYDKETIKLITKKEMHYIGLASHYYAEMGIALRLATLKNFPSNLNLNTSTLYASLRCPTAGDVELNEKQQMGIMTALQHKITLITGGPGTGKTTLIKKLLSILDQEKVTYKLTAPTGRAAKRIMEGSGRFATTIHRLLEFNVATMGFNHNEKNALKLDYLIVDEGSMIDIFLAHAVIKALPHTAHLILIGDTDQLPAVGPGNFLKDLIASNQFPVIHLTEIFRQAQDSLIIVNAHKVNAGEFPTTNVPNTKPDFIYLKETDPTTLGEHLKRALFVYAQQAHIKPADVQILVPMNRGTVGTQNLNHYLQQLLNPAKKASLTRHGVAYKEGDKVMQIRNNYDKNVFNGDIGFIETIDAENNLLSVNFMDTLVSYETHELDELVLAYATTIHKSQGSEYPAVVIPIFMQHFTLLQRNLLYTAITRAKKLCILIGETRAIAMAIKNNSTLKRITFLQEFLAEKLGT